MNFTIQEAKSLNQGLGLECLTKDIALYSGIVDNREGSLTKTAAESTIAQLVRDKKVDALDQGTVYLEIPVWKFWAWRKYVKDTKAMVSFAKFSMYITLGYGSVVSDKRFLKDMQKYLCPDNQPTVFHKIRRTVLWTTSKAVLNEFKSIFSPKVFSTIYEDAKQRDFSQLLFVSPMWFDNSSVEYDSNDIPVQKIGSADPSQEFARICFETEMHYKSLKAKGLKKDQLTNILSDMVAVPTIVTASEDAWKAAYLTVMEMSDTSSELKELMRKTEKALNLR